MLHPGSGDFSVTPYFTLANAQLFNEISGYLDFTLESDWFQFIFGGQFADAIAASFDASLLSSSVPLKPNPITLFTEGSRTNGFSFGDFSDVAGASALVAAPGPLGIVPVPAAGLLLVSGAGNLLALRRRKIA